ncbi:major facilitator superfamily [Micromonas commoda]|uniref:Major facilitator superfamily n=1 Tax=Micromonas commoda (strain RCC299 / NOUM17 / CCMP2709) TaxID=296587 RepID=C1EFU0_MICCC|nr:major facilitator superfamily [Micromonas commoda]ACO66909.1 major facilitator superfamily [Micromonas commoda]|eukprot:XP_002505651.1 major facilitator superfamily [Micromonas commoda]
MIERDRTPATARDGEDAAGGSDSQNPPKLAVGGDDEGDDEGEGEDYVYVGDDWNDVGPSLIPSIVTACLGAFLFGYHSAVINAPLADIAEDLGFGGDNFAKGAVVSIMVVGGFAGGLGIGPFADKEGRRAALVATTIPLALGTLVCGGADSLWTMMLGRFITGAGVGASTQIVPVYLSEVSPPGLRGTVNGIRRMGYVVGSAAAAVAKSVVRPEPGWWRPLFYFAAIPAVAQAAGALSGVAVESPVWLLGPEGCAMESRRSLAKLLGIRGRAAVRWQEAVAGSGSEAAVNTWGALFTEQRNRYPMIIGAGVCLLAGLSGSNTVIYYASSVLKEAGVDDPGLLTLVVGLPNVVGGVIALLCTDKYGRRPLLLWSFGGMAVCLAAFSTAASFEPLRTTTLVAIPLYTFFFSMGAGPVPWLLYSEVFPTRIRARATAVVTAINYVCNTIVGASFLPLIGAFGLKGTYAMYAVLCAIGYVFVDQLVFETKGLALQDIEGVMLAKEAQWSGVPLPPAGGAAGGEDTAGEAGDENEGEALGSGFWWTDVGEKMERVIDEVRRSIDELGVAEVEEEEAAASVEERDEASDDGDSSERRFK